MSGSADRDVAVPGLRPGRMHEVQGPGRGVFALVQAAACPGPLLWIADGAAELVPDRVAQFVEPSRLVRALPRRREDRLWAMEEGLRAGAFGLVIAEAAGQVGLTAGRRLQLAAEAGHTTGLLLTAPGAGTQAAETRWHCRPLPGATNPDSTPQLWSLIKNKSGTLGAWEVIWDGASRHLRVVSRLAGEPADAQGAGHS